MSAQSHSFSLPKLSLRILKVDKSQSDFTHSFSLSISFNIDLRLVSRSSSHAIGDAGGPEKSQGEAVYLYFISSMFVLSERVWRNYRGSHEDGLPAVT